MLLSFGKYRYWMVEEGWHFVEGENQGEGMRSTCTALALSLSLSLSIYLSTLYQPTNWPSDQRTWGVIGKLHFQQWRNLTLTYLLLFIFRLVTLPTNCPVPCELRGGSNENDVEMTTLAGKSWKTRPGFEEVNIGLYPHKTSHETEASDIRAVQISFIFSMHEFSFFFFFNFFVPILSVS